MSPEIRNASINIAATLLWSFTVGAFIFCGIAGDNITEQLFDLLLAAGNALILGLWILPKTLNSLLKLLK